MLLKESIEQIAKHPVLVFVSTRIGLITGFLSLGGFILGGANYFYTALNTHDINGEWKLTYYIESSSMKRYIGKSSGNKIVVNCQGEVFTAKGERWWVDDITIPYSEHDRIEFNGTLKGKELKATYTLYGARRTSVGSIDLTVVNDKEMTGTFTGTAADTKGKAVAIKL